MPCPSKTHLSPTTNVDNNSVLLRREVAYAHGCHPNVCIKYRIAHVFSALFCPSVLVRARCRSPLSLPCCRILVIFLLLLTDWLPGCLASWLVGWLPGWLAGKLAGQPASHAGWVAGWMVGWVGGWLSGWLAGWLAGCWPSI